MPTPEELKSILQADMPRAQITISDNRGSGDHFKVEISAQEFDGLSRLEQHRLVYASVQSLLDDGSVHALSIKTSVLGDDGSDD